MATSSVTELVQAVKRPRALSESTNRLPFMRKSGGGSDPERSEATGNVRRNSHAGVRTSMQKINELPDKKPKKTARRSFMGYATSFSKQ